MKLPASPYRITFTPSRFAISLLASAIGAFVLLAALRAFGVLAPAGVAVEDPAELARLATESLSAVRARTPGDRRPASYDSVLAPLDGLLRLARTEMQSQKYNPATGTEKIRAITQPVIDVAREADRLAKAETGYLTKDYRFNDQRGEASYYLASALWEKLQAASQANRSTFTGPAPLPQGDVAAIKEILTDGIEAAPDNRDLLYLRAVIARAEGSFAPAERDLARVVELDRAFSPAWNALGLVRITLRDFPGAEEALERARALALEAAEQSGTQPGEDYTSAVYNLASFHDGLATHYARENRIAPTAEADRLASRHAGEARRYFAMFLEKEPAASPDAETARTRLAALGR